MRRASREGWTWGAKTVRGAYMHVERARAARLGYGSPIQDSIAATHSNYNRCGRLLTLPAVHISVLPDDGGTLSTRASSDLAGH